MLIFQFDARLRSVFARFYIAGRMVFNILNSNSLQRYYFFLRYANNKSIKFVVF